MYLGHGARRLDPPLGSLRDRLSHSPFLRCLSIVVGLNARLPSAHRHEGKITPKVHLFKGKRSEAPAEAPDFLDELIEEVEGEAVSGEVLEATPEDSQEWLTDAIAQGAVSIPDEGPEDEVPHKDVGQDKPFKF